MNRANAMPSLMFLDGQVRDVSEHKDGTRLLVGVEIFGTIHHLSFIRVIVDDEGVQRGATYENETDLIALGGLYEVSSYQTVNVPGFDGNYVAYLHPYGD